MEAVTCAICHESFSPLDATVYITAEKLLMHRRCCDAHPSCRCTTSETISVDTGEVCSCV